MTDAMISVDQLSKFYLLGHNSGTAEKYVALRDVIARSVKRFARKSIELLQGKPIIQGDSIEQFWALRDVSFDVAAGDVVGIVGRNGAGKSTLLKVLSRITEPSGGAVTLRGRVASLLEVGTGFHPELSGRENIFLNGAILGMSRNEIKKKLDEIIDFAEVERFLDTPVKRYSSGMYVRLAFAVAAHLEPEILIVDEVLAVGDAGFQRKCLNRMSEVSTQGRTVLFVSHNLSAVQRLCNRAILLEQGKVKMQGSTDAIIASYLDDGNRMPVAFEQPNDTEKAITLLSASVRDATGLTLGEFSYQDSLNVVLEYQVNSIVRDAVIWVGVRTVEEVWAFGTSDVDVKGRETPNVRSPGIYRSTFTLPGKLLNAGRYVFVVGITHEPSKSNLDRVELPTLGISDIGVPEIGRPGVIAPLLNWEVEKLA